MSVLTRIIVFCAIPATTAIPALAAANDRPDPGGLAIWLFLGLCALIIIAQIVPFFRLIGKRNEKVADEAETVKQA